MACRAVRISAAGARTQRPGRHLSERCPGVRKRHQATWAIEVRIDHAQCALSVTAWYRAGHVGLGRNPVDRGREVALDRE